jgi:glycolate oxidase FAD binding subunit
VRVEGLEMSVRYRAGALAGAGFDGWEVVEGVASAVLWREVRDVAPFAGDARVVWRLSVKPSDAPEISAALTAQGLVHRGIYDWGGGLMWLALEDGGDDAGAALIRGQIAAHGGHAMLVRGPEVVRARIDVFEPQPAPVAALMRGLKHKFDPKGILNPGLMMSQSDKVAG